VRYWVHTGLVNLAGRKMSKTAGNTRLVRELLKRFSVDELRFYLLSWRYWDDAEFSFPKLERARRDYRRMKTKVAKGLKKEKAGGGLDRVLAPFYAAMDDDIDTPKALEWVEDELVKSPANPSALRVVSDVLGVDFLAGA